MKNEKKNRSPPSLHVHQTKLYGLSITLNRPKRIRDQTYKMQRLNSLFFRESMNS